MDTPGWETAAPLVEDVLDGAADAETLATVVADLGDVEEAAGRRAVVRATCDAGVSAADRVGVVADGPLDLAETVADAGVALDDERRAALDDLGLADADDPGAALEDHLAGYDRRERAAVADRVHAEAFDRAVESDADLDPRPGVDDPRSLARALARGPPGVDEAEMDVTVRALAGEDPDRPLAAFLDRRSAPGSREAALDCATSARRDAADAPTLEDLLGSDDEGATAVPDDAVRVESTAEAAPAEGETPADGSAAETDADAETGTSDEPADEEPDGER